jgi:hypothetical protein
MDCVPCPFTVQELRSMMGAHDDEAQPDSQGQEMNLEPGPILFW